MCQRKFECNCDNACCQGYTLHPAVWDDLFASMEEQEMLILYHECPECGGSVEA
jgi:hypothetical protein